MWTDEGSKEMTANIPVEKASVVSFQLKTLRHHELWKFDRLFYSGGFEKDTISMVHLEEEPRAHLPTSYDCLMFHIPDLVLRELCEQEELPAFHGLEGREARVDPVAAHLCRSLLPALDDPAGAGRLFFDHVGIALAAYLLDNYRGGSRPLARSSNLTRSQMNKIEEYLLADLTNDHSLEAVAALCEMPVSTFTKAFKETTGFAVHQWLRNRRVEKAARLLSESKEPIAGIAYECGFTDQAHLTRVFTRVYGTTPGSYRSQMTRHNSADQYQDALIEQA
ncbi:helix-turn-helix domain-containing protein [Sinorhizobium mexicanum]|uniref:helix-turn-helix domain-containing protein n=1 Tax=Sinorhizobium mexicanum TaxID=375549 RepID=UPI001AE5132D|nr:AraC family transcriptional regulator [Sinorhizobium mexicanum]